jgi:hypothetical protein
MVNWPRVWRPALIHGLELGRQDAVGEPFQVSNRGGHVGPIEYGCSPQFCEWLYDFAPARRRRPDRLLRLRRAALPLPARPARSVTAVAGHLRKEGLRAEDNAIVVLRYPRALGLLEASWTQIGGQPAYAVIVYGDSRHAARSPAQGGARGRHGRSGPGRAGDDRRQAA